MHYIFFVIRISKLKKQPMRMSYRVTPCSCADLRRKDPAFILSCVFANNGLEKD